MQIMKKKTNPERNKDSSLYISTGWESSLNLGNSTL